MAHRKGCVHVRDRSNCNPVFTSRIDDLIVEKDITYKQIYDAIGVNRTAFYHWRAFGFPEAIINFLAMADFLDVSLDYLLGRSDDPKIHSPRKTEVRSSL